MARRRTIRSFRRSNLTAAAPRPRPRRPRARASPGRTGRGGGARATGRPPPLTCSSIASGEALREGRGDGGGGAAVGAVAVAGHEAGHVVQVAQVARPRAARTRPSRRMRARLAVPTAQGGHCPQFSRSKKPATEAATASGQAEAPTTRTAPVPSAVPACAERVGVERRVELGGGRAAARRARRERRGRRPRSPRPPCSSITRRSGRPERHLVDAGAPHVAPQRDERRLARGGYASGSATARGHARERLDVLHERRPAPVADRRPAGAAWAAARPCAPRAPRGAPSPRR